MNTECYKNNRVEKTKRMQCLVVDDDPDFRNLVGRFVDQHPALDLAGTACSAEEAMAVLASAAIDLLFLDIDMPSRNGIELVRSQELVPQVVFITAHREYAVEAFEYDVTDYIVKPVNESRFNKAVDKALKNFAQRNEMSGQDHIFVKVDQKLVRIQFRDVDLVESHGDYVRIHCGDQVHTVHTRLNTMENVLKGHRFMRVHRKYLVRLDAIVSVEGYTLLLANGASVAISRNARPELNQALDTLV